MNPRGWLLVSLLFGCDGVASDPLEPDATTTPPDAAIVTGNKRVFVTDTVYQGGLIGGLAGADMKCEARAAAAGLAGTYKAWLSDATASAAGRLTHSSGAYLLVDGSMVAPNWEALTSGTLAHALNLDPFGAAHAAPIKCSIVGGLKAAWTSTKVDGAAVDKTDTGDYFCGNWTELEHGGLIGNGLVGNSQAMNGKWTFSNCGLSCTDEAALYCIEQ